MATFYQNTLQWRHNGRDSVSNYQPHDCLLNRLFRRRSKQTSKLRVICLCTGNSPGAGEFPAHGQLRGKCFHLMTSSCIVTEITTRLIYFVSHAMHMGKWPHSNRIHYNDIIMGAKASQITSLTIVYSIVYSDADQGKHQISASLAFVRGIHRGPVNSPPKWSVTRKTFPFDDVIMKWVIRWHCYFMFQDFNTKPSCMLLEWQKCE